MDKAAAKRQKEMEKAKAKLEKAEKEAKKAGAKAEKKVASPRLSLWTNLGCAVAVYGAGQRRRLHYRAR